MDQVTKVRQHFRREEWKSLISEYRAGGNLPRETVQKFAAAYAGRVSDGVPKVATDQGG